MKKSVKILGLLLFLSAVLTNNAYSQGDREWWDALSPAWKKVFQAQELKGKDIVPNDEQLDRIVKITHIDCSFNEEIEDLKPLSKLIFLEEIRCNDSKIISLEGIESLQNLKVLDCSNNDNINSLAPLSEIVSLEELNCGNTMVKNLTPLKKLVNLRVLDVHYSTVNKLVVISDLKSLQVLDVSQNQPLFYLDGVEGLVNLAELNCSETRVSDLSPVQNLKYLEILNLSNTSVETLRPLQDVKTLKELDFSNTNITGVSLDYLYSHLSLTMLRGREIDITEKNSESFESYYLKKNPNCTIILTPKSE
jgi:Leucine-rich repeat (LRR) protein